MSKVIWILENNNLNNEENLKIIADWWVKLEGKQVKKDSMQGIQLDKEGVREKLKLESFYFQVQEPRLEGNIISFKEQGCPQNYQAIRLELADKKELKVFYKNDNSPHYYFLFTLVSEQSNAFFKRESF